MKGVGRGNKIGKTEFKTLWYADDTVLIAENEDNLQPMLFELNQAGKQYNMSILIPKTKSMIIPKYASWHHINEQMMSIEYLGIKASSCRNTYDEVKTST